MKLCGIGKLKVLSEEEYERLQSLEKENAWLKSNRDRLLERDRISHSLEVISETMKHISRPDGYCLKTEVVDKLDALLDRLEQATRSEQRKAQVVGVVKVDQEHLDRCVAELKEAVNQRLAENAYDSAHDLVISCPPRAADIKRIIYNGAEIPLKGLRGVFFSIEAPGGSRPNFRAEYK